MNKVIDLHAVIDVFRPAFVLLTETWLKPHVPDSFIIDCNRYSVIRHDRTDGCVVCAVVDSKCSTVQIDTDPT